MFRVRLCPMHLAVSNDVYGKTLLYALFLYVPLWHFISARCRFVVHAQALLDSAGCFGGDAPKLTVPARAHARVMILPYVTQ